VGEDEEDGQLMLEVTWQWIALDKAALDVANTVAVDKGVEHDLLAPAGDYQRWAQAAAQSPELTPDQAAAIAVAQPQVLALRGHIRAILHATAAGEPLPGAAIAALNTASRKAAQWSELGDDRQVQQHALGDAIQRLLAHYARSTMEIAAGGSAKLRVCGAPSCGMFYRPRRRQQRWCSEPCGNRARVARHYRTHHKSSSPSPRPR
jgi:predicted RNA-binding Zn ribbon-like protein